MSVIEKSMVVTLFKGCSWEGSRPAPVADGGLRGCQGLPRGGRNARPAPAARHPGTPPPGGSAAESATPATLPLADTFRSIDIHFGDVSAKQTHDNIRE